MHPRRYFTKKAVVKRIVFILTAIVLITVVSSVTFYSASGAGRVIPSESCEGDDCCLKSDCLCPNCTGHGEPDGDCTRCGGKRLCGTCNGCLDCGYDRDIECIECGNQTVPAENKFTGFAGFSEVTVEDDPVPLFKINDRSFFLFAPMGIPTWSIFNLILAVTGIFLSLLTIIRALCQKREEFTEVDKCAAKIMSGDFANKDELLVFIANEDFYNKRRRLVALAVKYILSFASVLLLLLTQNFKGVVAIFDYWSAAHSIFFTGIIISGRFVFKNFREELLKNA